MWPTEVIGYSQNNNNNDDNNDDSRPVDLGTYATGKWALWVHCSHR